MLGHGRRTSKLPPEDTLTEPPQMSSCPDEPDEPSLRKESGTKRLPCSEPYKELDSGIRTQSGRLVTRPSYLKEFVAWPTYKQLVDIACLTPNLLFVVQNWTFITSWDTFAHSVHVPVYYCLRFLMHVPVFSVFFLLFYPFYIGEDVTCGVTYYVSYWFPVRKRKREHVLTIKKYVACCCELCALLLCIFERTSWYSVIL